MAADIGQFELEADHQPNARQEILWITPHR